MKKWDRFLPHLSFCMLLCLLVFMILDGYNPFMYWLTSTVSKVYIALCCGVACSPPSSSSSGSTGKSAEDPGTRKKEEAGDH